MTKIYPFIHDKLILTDPESIKEIQIVTKKGCIQLIYPEIRLNINGKDTEIPFSIMFDLKIFIHSLLKWMDYSSSQIENIEKEIYDGIK